MVARNIFRVSFSQHRSVYNLRDSKGKLTLPKPSTTMCIVINRNAAHLTNFSSNKLHNCQTHLSGYYVQVYLTEL